MDEMEECAQRACLRIALVTVIHSVTTRATGSIATVVLAVRRPFRIGSSMVGGCLWGTIWMEVGSPRDSMCYMD